MRLATAIALAALTAALPAAACAEGAATRPECAVRDGQPAPSPRVTSYVAARAGVFHPMAGDLGAFEDGRDLEVAFGLRFDRGAEPYLSAEVAAGHYRAASATTFAAAPVGGTLAETLELGAVPVTGTVRVSFDADHLVFTALGGAGVHFASMEATRVGRTASAVAEHARAFGLHLGGELGIALTSRVLLGLEARRTFVSATFFDAPTRLDGLRVAGTLRYRP
jgi:hypothetical protein